MGTTLKQKTVSGLTWSFIDKFASQFITFVVGIVLARLLTPAEFGLIGMLTVFIALSNTFIISGFNQALIRKLDCTEKDYATVFYFNLAVSVLFYAILVLTSGLISDFYNETQLENLIIVLLILFRRCLSFSLDNGTFRLCPGRYLFHPEGCMLLLVTLFPHPHLHFGPFVLIISYLLIISKYDQPEDRI